MKRLSIVFLVIFSFLFSACNNGTEKNEHATEPAMKPIDTLMMSQDTVNAYIGKMMDAYVQLISNEAFKDSTVLNTLAETRNVLYQISKGNYDQAKTDLSVLIGELEVALTRNPQAALIPIAVNYHKLETVDNIDTVRNIIKLAKKAFKDGYYQLSKHLLNTITSEMIITTTYLPISAYLQSMKQAAVLLDEKKYDEATVILVQSLNTVVNTDVSIPLPIVKAQVYIDWASNLDVKKDSTEVINLLDNAMYQIKLAEEMGYGKHDLEYKELYDAIKTLKHSVENKEDTKNKFSGLKDKLEKFRKRLFPIKKSEK